MRSGRPASIFIVFLLVVAAFDISSGLEHWPFGSYPMFSVLFAQHISVLRLYAVNGAAEVPLRLDRDFAPFDQSRLVSALSRLMESERARRELPKALVNLLLLHNRNTRAPIRTLRLYSVGWTLHPGLQPDVPPERKTRLAEVSAN
jgi:hypothetical protein